MRYILFAACLLVMSRTIAYGQNAAGSPHPIADAVSSLQPGLGHMPRNHIGCCSRKGALIGAAVGVGLAVVLAGPLSGASDEPYKDVFIKASIGLGAIGAGIGAIVGASHPNRTGPRIDVTPLLSAEVRAGVMTVRF